MELAKRMIQVRRFSSSSALIRNAERWRRSIVRDVSEGITPIEVVSKSNFKEWKSKQPLEVNAWLKATGNINPKPYSHIFLPVDNSSNTEETATKFSSSARVLYIANDERAADGDDGGLLSPYAFSSLASELPSGKYIFEPPLSPVIAARAELSWALGAYKFKRYNFKKYEKILDEKNLPLGPVLVSPLFCHVPTTNENQTNETQITSLEIQKINQDVENKLYAKLYTELGATATATYLVRDMINTPAEDCGPDIMEAYVKAVVSDAIEWGGGRATFKRTVGKELLKAPGYPMVYAVGRAAPPGHEPRMLEFIWTPHENKSKESSEEAISLVIGNVAGSMTGTLVGVDGVGQMVGTVVSEVVSDIMHKMAEEGELELKLQQSLDDQSKKKQNVVLNEKQLKDITLRVAKVLEEQRIAEETLAKEESINSLRRNFGGEYNQIYDDMYSLEPSPAIGDIDQPEGKEEKDKEKEEEKSKKEKERLKREKLRKAIRAANSKKLPRVTLIGKGVTFDTGGLNLKPGDSMLTMKKDMGGAAQVLGLAHMIMRTGLRVRLRVLIPCAENSVGSSSYRPGDVLTARNGITVEVGNTDAEGRLLLADALIDADHAENVKRDEVQSGALLGHLATDLAEMLSDIMTKKLDDEHNEQNDDDDEEEDLIIDCATLTGAARVATGSEVGAVFSNRLSLSKELQEISFRYEVRDLLWAQPLLKLYKSQLNSEIANLKNVGTGGLGGHITAALFLQEFLRKPMMIKNKQKLSENELLVQFEESNHNEHDETDVTVEEEEEEGGGEGEEGGEEKGINTQSRSAEENRKDNVVPTTSENETSDTSKNENEMVTKDNQTSSIKEDLTQESSEKIPEKIPDLIRRPTTPWIHVDMMAFNTTARPGRPKGGEAQGMRTLYTLLASKYTEGGGEIISPPKER